VELHYNVSKRCSLGDSADLPSHAGQTLREWQAQDDEEFVRRFDGPITIDPRTGNLFRAGRVIWGSTDYPRERSPGFLRHLCRPNRILDQAICLHHLFPNNYFHFFNNIASKLPLIERVGLAPDIPLLVPADLAQQHYFQGARELGLFGNRPIIVQGRDELIAASTVYVVKAHDCTLATHEWVCESLVVRPDPDADAWVYIERGKGSPNARHFRNNAELHALLAAHDIRIIDPQSLPLSEQIAMFANARVIISAHGAGLTNIIFRRMAPCTVVELFNPAFGTPHYYLTALQHGFEYLWLGNLNQDSKKGLVASSVVNLAALEGLIRNLETRIPNTRSSRVPTRQFTP
jgi:hypothetical protein